MYEIEKIQNSLFGGNSESKSHLINWNVVSRSKESDGLGIGGIINRNQALLGKWLKEANLVLALTIGTQGIYPRPLIEALGVKFPKIFRLLTPISHIP